MAGPVRRGRGSRRSLNEINMVPLIDVMLVLLIIFMVTAPLMATGVVDVPGLGRAQDRAPQAIELRVRADGSVELQRAGKPARAIPLDAIGREVKAAQGGNAATPVVVAADKRVAYERVMQAMDALQRAGVARIALAVQRTP